MITQITAQIVKKNLIATDTYEVEFKTDPSFTFLAGQYVWVILPKLDFPDPNGERRAFSISSSDKEVNKLSIIFRTGQSGYKKTLLALPVGASVIIAGPHGSSFTLNSDMKELVLIAGGTGLAPFLSIVRSLDATSQIKISILNFNNSEQKSFCIEELKELTKKKGFTFINSLHQINDELFKQIDISAESQFFVSGPQLMVNAVFSLLNKHGISKSAMRFENFYPQGQNNLSHEYIDKFLQNKDDFGVKFIEESDQHIVITDQNATILYANSAAQKITGYKLSEMIGQTPRLWGGMMSGEFYETMWEKKSRGEPFVGEFLNRRKSGEVYHSLAHISPLKDQGGEVIGYMASEEDITERVEVEKKLTQTESFLNSIVENLPSMIFVKDAKDLKFVLFNKTGEELIGVSKQDMLGKSDYDFFPKDQADFFISNDREVLSSKVFKDIPEEPIETKVHGKRVLHTKKVPILDQAGNPVYLLGISEDITEQKNKELELEKLNKFMVGRELKMVELKKEIAKLKEDKK